MRILALTLAALLSTPFVGGCSVAMALDGSPDPDLRALADHGNRELVEAQLGPAVSETVEADGSTVATYAFARGNEPSTLRAVAHCAFDVLSFGLWEIAGVMIERAVDEKDHEVQVVYAENQQVIALRELPPARAEGETAIVTAESDAPE
jgi:hypothetical protein